MKAHIPNQAQAAGPLAASNNRVTRGSAPEDIEGDMAAPVSTWNGASRTTTKEESSWTAFERRAGEPGLQMEP